MKKLLLGLCFIFCILSCSTKPYPRFSQDGHEAFTSNYMITTQGRASSQAGVETLKAGGNIVDAAVAISFAIAVERPQSTGLGGGGFMLMAGGIFKKPMALDFREKAPLASTANMYLDKNGDEIKGKSINGIHASGVPGMVSGVLDIHQRYGKMPLWQVMAPAIRLAEKGFKVYPHLANAIKVRLKTIQQFSSSSRIFLNDKGQPYKVGDTFIQKDLANSLRLIAKEGKNVFYNGTIGNQIVATSKKYNGILSKDDFKKYHSVWREPVKGEFKDYDVYSMSPPSSGGIHVIEMLNILERFKLSKNYDLFDPQAIHLTASAMQAAFADRAKYLGDADFVKVPTQQLISKKYASKVSQKIHYDKARKSSDVSAGEVYFDESSDTTHFTIMAKDGSTISSTQTINGLLGSGLVAEGTGIVLNNEMDDFATKVGASNMFGAIGGSKNLVEPQKRPLSSMSPTIVMKGKLPILALGTPNGTRIITCTTLVALNYLEYKLPLYGAVAAKRYHHQWFPDKIFIEEPGLPSSTMSELKNRGHNLELKKMGCKVQAIAREGEGLHGVSDPRGEGMAIGF